MTKSKAEMKNNKVSFPAGGIRKKKITQGRKKIAIEKIANVNNRQVTFSKRRVGLFKKAAEICILTGARVGLIVQSSGKRVYTFGDPDIDTVLVGYQNGYQIPAQPWSEADRHQQRLHNEEYNKLCLELGSEKKMLAALENADDSSGSGSEIPWFEKPLDGMSLEELYEILTPLEELQKNVENSLNGVNVHASRPLAITNGSDVDHDHFGQSLKITDNSGVHDYFSQPMDAMNTVNHVDSSQPLTLMYNLDSSQPNAINTGSSSGVEAGDSGVVNDESLTFDFFPNGDYFINSEI